MEPGKDGVGDYTRRLAEELCRLGYRVGLIAIHDSFLQQEILENQQSKISTIPMLRISTEVEVAKKIELAKDWIDGFNPDWVSLQFVPFAFHQKGLPINLEKMLVKLGGGRKWHIMCHELWLGMENAASFKLRIWGLLQKWVTIKLIKKLDPLVVHTHSNLYQHQLQKAGVPAKILPLFGNIPIIKGEDTCIHVEPQRHTKRLTLVHFGNIHEGSPVNDFVSDVKLFEQKMDVEIVLILIGRCGKEGDYWSEVCKEKGLKIKILGEQPPEKVSSVFLGADFGISSTPFALLQKSGSVAAMREHGLPIICISKPWNPRGFANLNNLSNVENYIRGNIEKCFSMKPTGKKTNNAQSVTEQFLQNII